VHIQIDAHYDPARWAAAFRHVARGRLVRVRVCGALLVVIGPLFMAIERLGGRSVSLFGPFVMVLGVLFALLLPALAIRASVRQVPHLLRHPSRIELTEHSFKTMSPLFTGEYAWGAFVRIDEIPGQLLLLASQRQVFSVPTNTLHPTDLAQLRAFAANFNFVRR
jgi:hypothetical protein